MKVMAVRSHPEDREKIVTLHAKPLVEPTKIALQDQADALVGVRLQHAPHLGDVGLGVLPLCLYV